MESVKNLSQDDILKISKIQLISEYIYNAQKISIPITKRMQLINRF